MDNNNLNDLILWGREERNLEYKASLDWSSPETKAKLTKSVLAMSNLRDGGHIVIGVARQTDDRYIPEGMTAHDADSFVQDHVTAYISEFADPYVDVTVIKHNIEGKLFCVLQVAEFAEIPVVCKKDGQKLRRGATYTRGRRMIETVEVPSHIEMREILDLATEKRVRAFYEQTTRLGFKRPEQEREVSEKRYWQQRGLLGDTEIIRKILAKPYWRIWIRPTVFKDARFRDLAHCEEFMYRNAVRYSGASDYPYVRSGSIDSDESGQWIACEAELLHELERWVLFRSGQFVHYLSLPEIKELGGKLHFRQVVQTVSQAFEFATRMAHQGILSPEGAITVELKRVDGFGLLVPDPAVSYWCQEKDIEVEKQVSAEDLEARSRELALDVVIDVYKEFGWMDAPRSLLVQEQERLR